MLHQKSLLFALLSVLSVGSSFAQTGNQSVRSSANALVISEVPLKKEDTVGSTYLEDEWRPGSVVLKDGRTITDVPLKYDIKNGLMEIKTETQIKVLEKARIEKFEWMNNLLAKSTFINANAFTHKGTTMEGFFEVLSNGKIKLVVKTELELIKADYNIALNVGSKTDRIEKKEKFYLAKGNEVTELPKKERDVLAYFGDKQPQAIAFVKQHSLRMKNREDLVKLFNEFKTLLR